MANLSKVNLKDGDKIEADFETGQVMILTAGTRVQGLPFSEVQMSIYRRGGLLAR